MDIQEVDLETNVIRSCLQGSRRLVVGFESGGDGSALNRPDRPAWAQALVGDAGWDGLFTIPKVLDWYQTRELWAFFKTMQKSGFFDAYDSVVTYGSSMGGFAALAFSGLTGAERVVAFQPRSTLRYTVPWPSMESAVLSYNRVGPHADAVDGLGAETEVLIFADPFYERDWAHAQRVPGAEIFRAPFAGHKVPELLNDLGIMGTVARRAVEGTLERRWYNNALRGRKDSGLYQQGVAAALLSRGKPEGAVV